MEEIFFEENVVIYKTRMESTNVLGDIKTFLESTPYSPKDNYTYMGDWSSFDFQNEMRPKNSIEEIIKFGMESCLELRNKTISPFNKININSWINIVKRVNQNKIILKREVKLHYIITLIYKNWYTPSTQHIPLYIMLKCQII